MDDDENDFEVWVHNVLGVSLEDSPVSSSV